MWPDMLPPPGMLAGVLAQPNAPMMPDVGMPQPGAPMMPQAAPQAPPPKPSLWQRISERLMPVPRGFEGVLSPTDIATARQQGMLALGASMLESSGPSRGPRVSLGQAIGRGLQASSSAFNNVLENATKISQFAEERRLAQEERQNMQRMESEREKIILQAMQGADSSNPQDVATRLNAVLPELMRIGDTKGYGALSGYLAANNALLNSKPKARDIRTVVTGSGPGAEVIWYDNDNAEIVRREPLQLKGDTTGDRQERRMDAQNLNAILDDYRNDAGKTVQLLTRIRPTVSQTNFDRALKNDAAAQISLLYGFVNLMDETAVREGEQAMVRQAGPLYEQAKGIIQRSVLGQAYSVPPTLIKQIFPIMKERVGSFSSLVKESRERAMERARILGIDGIDRLIKPYTLEDDAGPLGSGQPMVVPGAAPTIRRYVPPGR